MSRPALVAAVAWSGVMSRFVLGALALIGAGWTMSGHVIQEHLKVPGAHTVMLRNGFVKKKPQSTETRGEAACDQERTSGK